MSKRANGEGHIRKRADGRWEMVFMTGYNPVTGQRQTKSFYAAKQSEVKKKAKEYWDARRAGLDINKKYSFSEYADIWFEHHKKNIAVATQENYRYVLRILKEKIGNQLLTSIKAQDVENLLRQLQEEGRSDSYITKARGILFQIMNKAEANDLSLKNPVRLAEKMRKTASKSTKDAFTAEEIRLLLEQLPWDRLGISIRLALATGLRSQELLALEASHIEADGSALHIRQAITMHKGTVHIGPPKTAYSYRDVPIPVSYRPCAIYLRGLADNRKFIWEVGRPNMPCNPSHYRSKYKEALEKIDRVRLLSPHSCRHSYVSHLQALGIDLSTIQSLIGHSERGVTQKYLHVQKSIQQEAINKYDEAFPLCVPEWLKVYAEDRIKQSSN